MELQSLDFDLIAISLRSYLTIYSISYNHLISNKREWNNCLLKTIKKYC